MAAGNALTLSAELEDVARQMRVRYPDTVISVVATGASHLLVGIEADELNEPVGLVATMLRRLADAGIAVEFIGGADVPLPAAETQPMELAPTNGQVIEVLFDGDWYEVHWSNRADGGSPYGCEGWRDTTSGMQMPTEDLEGWREPAEYQAVDEYAEGVARQAQFEADAESERKNAAHRPRRTKTQMAEAPSRKAAEPERAAAVLGALMAGYGL